MALVVRIRSAFIFIFIFVLVRIFLAFLVILMVATVVVAVAVTSMVVMVLAASMCRQPMKTVLVRAGGRQPVARTSGTRDTDVWFFGRSGASDRYLDFRISGL